MYETVHVAGTNVSATVLVRSVQAIDQPLELTVGRFELAVGQFAIRGERTTKARIGLELQETPSGAVVVLLQARVEPAVRLDRDVSRDGHRVDVGDA